MCAATGAFDIGKIVAKIFEKVVEWLPEVIKFFSKKIKDNAKRKNFVKTLTEYADTGRIAEFIKKSEFGEETKQFIISISVLRNSYEKIVNIINNKDYHLMDVDNITKAIVSLRYLEYNKVLNFETAGISFEAIDYLTKDKVRITESNYLFALMFYLGAAGKTHFAHKVSKYLEYNEEKFFGIPLLTNLTLRPIFDPLNIRTFMIPFTKNELYKSYNYLLDFEKEREKIITAYTESIQYLLSALDLVGDTTGKQRKKMEILSKENLENMIKIFKAETLFWNFNIEKEMDIELGNFFDFIAKNNREEFKAIIIDEYGFETDANGEILDEKNKRKLEEEIKNITNLANKYVKYKNALAWVKKEFTEANELLSKGELKDSIATRLEKLEIYTEPAEEVIEINPRPIFDKMEKIQSFKDSKQKDIYKIFT